VVKNAFQYKRGFTLIEMLIVLGIFTIFTMITLADYKKFGIRHQFVNYVYDLALTLRQVQTSGIAARESGVGSENYDNSFGIHFSPTTNIRSYVIFVDREDQAGGRNMIYGTEDLDGSGLPVETKATASTDYTIRLVCAYKGGTPTCLDTNTSGSLDITFRRPDPDAHITLTVGGGVPDSTYTSAKISITSEKDSTLSRIITVDAAGQISIQ
jgi:prepilin-type N-terminal cleavage/methylation domain-containing protein